MQPAPLLVVDDEPRNLDVMRQILSGQHRLVYARSGDAALAAARKHRPALILLDIEMPGENGYSVCRRLKADADTAEIPVIFVTAMSDVGDEEAGFEAGAVDYITKPVSPSVVRARVQTHLSLVSASRLERSHRDAVYMLGEAGHFRDTDTGVHTWRMAAYSAALAQACGWSAADCQLMDLAAPMHDLGKLGIPDAILRKPGKLDAAEWNLIKTHSRIGHDILARSDAPVFRLGAEIALHHHERWDGAGYPGRLAGEAIPEGARIVAVADVFDALTMPRPYKEAWPVEQAMAMVRQEAGSHFEPRLVQLFDANLLRILELKALWDAKEQAG
jgi:putative two-component system response regulator